MRKVETTQIVFLTCDTCWKVEEEKSVWYNIWQLSLQGLRVYEKIWKNSFEIKHLVWKNEMNFCCKDCITKWLSQQVIDFVEELTPVIQKERETITF